VHNFTILSDIEELIRQKFLAIREFRFTQLPKKSDVIAILSGPEIEIAGENGKRIDKALEIQHYYQSKKSEVPVIYLGTAGQTKQFDKYLSRHRGITSNTSLNIGKTANTLDQIKKLALLAKQRIWENIVLVTTSYHVPRVDAYCRKHFKGKLPYFIAYHGTIHEYQDRVPEEIQRIIRYAQKGDLILH